MLGCNRLSDVEKFRLPDMNNFITAELAFVSSGLGHVGRGNERGATTAAEATHAAGASVLLIGGGLCKPRCAYAHAGNIRRDQPLLRWLPWDKRYLLEQYTFVTGAMRQIARHSVKVVVAADPALALLLHRRSRRARFQVVYQDGLLLGPPWCSKFDHVQVLAPHYLEEGRQAGCDTRGWRVIPHLVDLKTFADEPAGLEERRKWLGPSYNQGEPVVLGVGISRVPAASGWIGWLPKWHGSRTGCGRTCCSLAIARTRLVPRS